MVSARKGLALGPVSRQAWHPLHRDGDLIPCSMTIALLAYLPRIVAFLVLKWCPRSRLWSQCRGWVGWALNVFKNSTWEAKPGTMPLIWCGSRVQGISETTSLWCRTSRRGQHLLASSAASGRPWLPICRDGDVIPCSMTIAILFTYSVPFPELPKN